MKAIIGRPNEFDVTEFEALDVSGFLADIPAELRPAVDHLSAAIGPTWDKVQGAFLVRLREYVEFFGVTPGDVRAACAYLLNPQTQAACKFADDWLRAFAEGVTRAKGDRLRAERNAAEAEKRAEAAAVADAERGKVQAQMAEMRKRFKLPPRKQSNFAAAWAADAFVMPN